ncbi:hypothetical protein IVA87_30215 [Bradyrhizobium sp. 147]|uniref:hypothetical protein n=1 Tax=unclassified Bradyrhizobium TaxID=2631580 RepID=UPI001FF8179A|nr:MULTISPECIES: hypothetical protein [unclassified Bradyrhizobium]MCK1626877.1 hypothetical protein [Bradyrhizobium sp. 160]MCK1683558.1 hypothetical protein [Bradyrhizobium sp. 147]
MVDRQYLTRQATTLLKFAKATRSPEVSAALVEKAADLKSKADESAAGHQSQSLPRSGQR